MKNTHCAPFWMIAGDGPCAYRHESRDAAEREAKRLARAHPETSFFVMRAVRMFRCIDVEITDIPSDPDADEIPF